MKKTLEDVLHKSIELCIASCKRLISEDRRGNGLLDQDWNELVRDFLGDKSSLTNLVSLAIIAIGYATSSELFKAIGFFAFSGAITNWLAIHMLFEKVPFLYGSGIIPAHFEEFKASIKALMMQQFFTVENIEQFIETEEHQGGKVLNLEPLLNAVDYDKIYEGLVSSIMT